MKTATGALCLVRLTGPFQLATGLLFWMGNALPLLAIHLLSVLVLVLSLWTIAVLALRGGVPRLGARPAARAGNASPCRS